MTKINSGNLDSGTHDDFNRGIKDLKDTLSPVGRGSVLVGRRGIRISRVALLRLRAAMQRKREAQAQAGSGPSERFDDYWEDD